MPKQILSGILISNGYPKHIESIYTHVAAIFRNPEAKDKLSELICHEQPESVTGHKRSFTSRDRRLLPDLGKLSAFVMSRGVQRSDIP